jgi:hypothetical protein
MHQGSVSYQTGKREDLRTV